ncbi:hydrolase 76 protein [Podochytrium sp. JEL0797]|nr:hydrolase 76 protein [Podochytrium sp. JEL0797]
MRLLALLFLAVTCIQAQQSIDLASKTAVIAAAKAAMAWMPYYYTSPQQDGSWDQTIVQWHESGEYFTQFYTYRAISGDGTYDDFADGQMILATVGDDFLDGNNPILGISGRWNDDIGVMTAAEVFGPSAVVLSDQPQDGGSTYLSIVENTWSEMLQQWDTTTCGGGIYWARNRQAQTLNQRYYKSSIANGQHMELGARLYAMTGNETYRQWADTVYAWMKSKVMTPDYQIYDGVTADDPNDCGASKLNSAEWSYQLAELISANAILFQKTKTAAYLTEAHNLYHQLSTNFVKNGILYDPGCAAAGACKSPTGFLWPVYKSLADLYGITTDATVQASITQVMQASATANFQGCNANWNCIRTLAPGTPYTYPNGTNPRDQFETVSILNNLARINGAAVIPATQSVTPNTGSSSFASGPGGSSSGSGATSRTPSSNPNAVAIYGGLALAVVIVTAVAAYFIHTRNKKKADKESLKAFNESQILSDARRVSPSPQKTRNGHNGDQYAMQNRNGGGSGGARTHRPVSPPQQQYGAGAQYGQAAAPQVYFEGQQQQQQYIRPPRNPMYQQQQYQQRYTPDSYGAR